MAANDQSKQIIMDAMIRIQINVCGHCLYVGSAVENVNVSYIMPYAKCDLN